MTQISYTEERTLQVPAAPAQAYAFFADPRELFRVLEGVERLELLGDGRTRVVLGEKAGQGVRFKADYTIAFEGDGVKQVLWSFVEGNVHNEGEVRVTPLDGGGSQIEYRETVAPDLPITSLTARLIKPLVVRELKSDLNNFLERAEQALSA